jgi:hypothetical protein
MKRTFRGCLLFAGLLSPAPLCAQQPWQSVLGTVRDTAGNPLNAAEVLLGKRKTSTGASGHFRFDSVAVGTYSIVVRLIGYEAAHSRIAVLKSEPTEVDYYLVSRPLAIDPLVVEIKRTGLYGTVGDTAYRAMHGAKVDVIGANGGSAFTDSAGHFSFPTADRGLYMVRVSFPGYYDRWFTLKLRQGEGRQLGVLLAPGRRRHTNEDDQALFDLRHRIALNSAYNFLSGRELERFGGMALCDIPRLRRAVGDNYIVVVDGTRELWNWSLCAWTTDEITLIELSRPPREVPTSIRADAANSPIHYHYIGIWLKR